MHLRRHLAHHQRRRGNLADRFLLHAQAGKQCRDQRRRYFAAHDLAHQVDHLVVKDLPMLDRALQRLLGSDGHGLPLSETEARSSAVALLQRKYSGGQALFAEKIAQQVMAVFGQDRFRMKL